MSAFSVSRGATCLSLAALVFVASACRETGTIRVKSLNFKGVKGVDVGLLRGALATKTSSTEVGVCCNPGCTDRVQQCAISQFCCGEIGSPYQDPNSCLKITATSTSIATKRARQ